MREQDFDMILKEHFDVYDRASMKKMLSLNESEQNQAMAALASKLYQKIVDRVDDIDFGTIPASKGDITKIGNYMEMRECMDIIRDIIINYKQDTKHLDTIDKAIENIKSSKDIWVKAYAIDCDFAITYYNTIALSIVSAISLMISSSIDFIKEPSDKTFSISFNNVAYSKSKDKLLFQNLERFNKLYLKGDITKVMNAIVKSNSSLKEYAMEEIQINEDAIFASLALVVGAGTFIVLLVSAIIPVLHGLTSVIFCFRQDIADYFELQARVVQFNAEQLKYDYTKSEAEINKIYNKQMKIVERFKKISNKFAIKVNKAEAEAKRVVIDDNKEKYKAEDLTNDAPDIIGTQSSIF